MAPIALLSVYCLVFAIRQKDGRTVMCWWPFLQSLSEIWLVRSLILSGCVVYPVPLRALTVELGHARPASMVKDNCCLGAKALA